MPLEPMSTALIWLLYNTCTHPRQNAEAEVYKLPGGRSHAQAANRAQFPKSHPSCGRPALPSRRVRLLGGWPELESGMRPQPRQTAGDLAVEGMREPFVTQVGAPASIHILEDITRLLLRRQRGFAAPVW